MRIFLTIFLLFFATSAHAYFFPEYEHLTSQDQNEINAPRFFDGEYQSDKLAYEFPLDWMMRWLPSNRAFQYGAGSLGPSRFLTRGRMKIREELAPNLFLQLAYLESGDFENHKNALVFEFGYRPLNFVELALYGESETLKKEDNIGLASTFLLGGNHSLRTYYTWVNFSHNKRNEDSDTYSKKPASTGLVWRWFNEETQEALQLSYRNDLDTQRDYVESNRTYIYGWQNLSFFSRFALDDERLQFLQTKIEMEKGYEGDTVKTDNGILRWDTERVSALVQHQLIGSFIDLYGIKVVHQSWKSSQGQVIHNDILPHLWSPLYFGRSENMGHQLDLGYEFTWHRAQGDMRLRSLLDTNDKLEHRANVRYQAQFNDDTFLNFLLTFDLDEFGTGETWEGGSMQFTWNF